MKVGYDRRARSIQSLGFTTFLGAEIRNMFPQTTGSSVKGFRTVKAFKN
jgi:hypothetical protein